MIKRLFAITLFLLLCGTQAFPQSWSGMIGPQPPVIQATDCSVYPAPLLCYDTDDTAYTLIDDLVIGSTSSGKNLSVVATREAELLTWGAAAWNEDGVTWTFIDGVLTHVTGNTTAVTATLGAAVEAGVTYEVTITGTGGGATATYTLGGVTGTTIAASGAIAITDRITASTTGSLIITPANTCTVALTLVSVKKFTNATGDLTVDGNLTVRSPVTFNSQVVVPYLPTALPGIVFGTQGEGLSVSAANTLRYVTNGTTRVFLNSAGRISSQAANGQFDIFDDTILLRDGANVWQMGIDAATASAQTLKAADSSGAGNAGANLTIKGGTPGTGGTYGKVKIANGSTGGIFRAVAEATASIEADESTTITLNIPAGARLLGCQLRVDTALTATELWDAAFSGGSTTAIAAAQAVAKNTKVNLLIVDQITSDVTNIAITKNGGGSFTAAGVIHAWAYYEVLDTLADAP